MNRKYKFTAKNIYIKAFIFMTIFLTITSAITNNNLVKMNRSALIDNTESKVEGFDEKTMINKKDYQQKNQINQDALTPVSPYIQTQNSTAIDINYKAPTTFSNVKNNPGYVDTSNFTYIGPYNITGYTPKCVHCCGNDKGITASTAPAIVGRTIATSKEFDFGTTLYIKGYGFYVVEDRGAFPPTTIDVAASTHEECYSITASEVDVYLVSNN